MTKEILGGHDNHPALANGSTEETRAPRPLPAAAQRALAEAAARRRETELAAAQEEVGGRGGLDPVRFGDWEVKGLTSDF